jgi:hypothetical protein
MLALTLGKNDLSATQNALRESATGLREDDGVELSITHTARCVLRLALDLVASMGDMGDTIDLHTRAFVRSLFHSLRCGENPPSGREDILRLVEQLEKLQGAPQPAEASRAA